MREFPQVAAGPSRIEHDFVSSDPTSVVVLPGTQL